MERLPGSLRNTGSMSSGNNGNGLTVPELHEELERHLRDLLAEGLRLEQTLQALRGQVFEVQKVMTLTAGIVENSAKE